MSGGFAGITPAPVPRAISGRRMGGAKNFRSKEMWGKAKLLVLQRVNEAVEGKGLRRCQPLPQANEGDEEDEEEGRNLTSL